MRKLILRFYLTVRKPRNFLKIVCVFVATSLSLHWLRGYDPDWGATNLILSIDATIASTIMLMIQEEGAERIKPALRWLAARYGYTLGAVAAQPTTGEEVERSVAIAIRTASDACAKTIEAAVDGIQEDERPDVTLALRRSIEALTDTLNKIESAPTAKPRLRTAGALTFGHQS